jgi:hypothetical protein
MQTWSGDTAGRWADDLAPPAPAPPPKENPGTAAGLGGAPPNEDPDPGDGAGAAGNDDPPTAGAKEGPKTAGGLAGVPPNEKPGSGGGFDEPPPNREDNPLSPRPPDEGTTSGTNWTSTSLSLGVPETTPARAALSPPTRSNRKHLACPVAAGRSIIPPPRGGSTNDPTSTPSMSRLARTRCAWLSLSIHTPYSVRSASATRGADSTRPLCEIPIAYGPTESRIADNVRKVYLPLMHTHMHKP